MKCVQDNCRVVFKGHLSKWPTVEQEVVGMIFIKSGSSNHDSDFDRQRWSSRVARDAIHDQIRKGVGPTEAHENVGLQMSHNSLPTLASIRKSRKPGVNTPTTQESMLFLLKRTLDNHVCQDSTVPGYIQVKLLS